MIRFVFFAPLLALAALAQQYAVLSGTSTPVARYSFLSSGRHIGGKNNLLSDSSLIGYWPLVGPMIQAKCLSNCESTSPITVTQAQDISGNNHPAYWFSDLTASNATPGLISQGKFGLIAPYFPGGTGTAQGFEVPSFSINYSALTVSVWVRPNSPTHGYNRIVEHVRFSSGFYLGTGGSTAEAKIETIVKNSTVDTCESSGSVVPLNTNSWSSSSLNPGTNSSWHHLVSTYNGSTATLYVDGTAVASSCSFTSPGTVTGTLAIGTCAYLTGDCANTGAGAWDGQIQDLRIYSRVLSATEISSLYNFGLNSIR